MIRDLMVGLVHCPSPVLKVGFAAGLAVTCV